jgi:hypothetical protein
MIRLRGSPTVLRNGLAHAGTRDPEKSTQFHLRAVVDPHELFQATSVPPSIRAPELYIELYMERKVEL